MPVYPISFLVPQNPDTTKFLLEDIYFRGGLRVVKDIADRDAIALMCRKVGMLVVTADTNKVWQLQSDKITFNEFVSGGGGKDLTGVFPISVLVNGDVSIDLNYILPQTGAAGDVLRKDSNGKAAWQTVNFGGNTGVRTSAQFTPPGQIDGLSSYDFELSMSQTVLMLQTKVDIPQIKLEGFSTPTRNEQNPYTFISTPDLLEDNGISVLSDGSLFYGRRYNVLANLEEPALNKIYWRITNMGSLPVTPNFTFTYVVLQ